MNKIYTLIYRLLLIGLGFILFGGCKSKQAIVPVPLWIAYPNTDTANYYGVGHAKKIGLVYYEKAKQDALVNLSSAIQFHIQSNRILVSNQKDEKFLREFSEIIQLSIDQKLENYEEVDRYETEEDYYVRYKLNKKTYQEALIKKKNLALTQATRFYAKGLEAKQQFKYSDAIIYFAQSLDVLKDFSKDDPQIIVDGHTLAVLPSAYTNIQDIINRLEFRLPKQELEGYYGAKMNAIKVGVFDQQVGIAQCPLLITSSGNTPAETSILTQNSGYATLSQTIITQFAGTQTMTVQLDLYHLLQKAQVDFSIRQWLLHLKSPSTKIDITLNPPTLYIQGLCLNLNKSVSPSLWKDPIITQFENQGFTISSQQSQANYRLLLNLNTKTTSQTPQLSQSALTGQISIKDQQNNTRYALQVYPLIGRQLTPERAGLNAYTQFTQRFQSLWMNDILNALITP